MGGDYYASNTVSLVLAWIFCLPVLFAVVGVIFSFFQKREGIPWFVSAWMGLFFLWLSPIRYMFFQIIAATAYPVQSFFAFGSLFHPGVFLLVPMAFSILYALGFVLPLFLNFLLVGDRWWRNLLACIAAPILALLGSVIFGFLLPVASGVTTQHLRGDDIIRSTNGPAYIAFTYLVTDIERVDVPRFFARTPMTSRDYLRTHVAMVYLGENQQKEFLEKAYPEIADQSERSQ
jgi:hypothetical protein